MSRTNFDAPARRAARVILAAAAAAVLAACAATPAQPGSDAALLERAQARWDALLAKDYDAAYALYSPGYRSAHTRTDFEIHLRTQRVGYTSATYRDHECEGDVCTVNFNIEYRAPRPVPGVNEWKGRSVVSDAWVRTDGQWWFVPPK